MGIRGALSSLPAFVAAPDAAQPLTEGIDPAQPSQGSGEGKRPVIEPHPQPQQSLETQERNPQPKMDIDQPDDTKNVTSSLVGVAPNQSQAIGAAGTIGVQTVWPPSGPSGEDTDESGSGFGYATVRPVGYVVSPKDSDQPPRPLPEVPAQHEHVHVHESPSGVGDNSSRSHHPDAVNFSDDGLYTKVKKSSHKKALSASVGLPPRTPAQSEQTGKRENSPIFQMRTRQGGAARHDQKNTDEITPSPSERARQRQAHSNKIDSTLVYHFDDGLAGETERRGSWEGAEYADEEYIPSGDDTFSITETNFSEEDLILPSDLSPRNSKRDQAKQHGRSIPYLSHHSACGYRSATPGGERHTRRTRARSDQFSHRPVSAPPQPNPDSIPFIRPSFIQHFPSTHTHPQSQLDTTTDGEVYIFSEAQGDGSVQYYTATPVHTPTRTSQASYRTPAALIQQPATPTLGSHFRHYSNPTNPVQPQQQYTSPANPMQPLQYASPMQPQYTSSGNQQYTSPANQQYTSSANPVQSQQYALSASGRDKVLRGTKITKLGGPVSQNSPRTASPPSVRRATVPADAGLDQTDANTSAESPRTLTGVAKPLMSSHSMSRDQDKIRSLSVTLDQQLVSEQRYLKVKEVSYNLYYYHECMFETASFSLQGQLAKLGEEVTELRDENIKLVVSISY